MLWLSLYINMNVQKHETVGFSLNRPFFSCVLCEGFCDNQALPSESGLQCFENRSRLRDGEDVEGDLWLAVSQSCKYSCLLPTLSSIHPSRLTFILRLSPALITTFQVDLLKLKQRGMTSVSI